MIGLSYLRARLQPSAVEDNFEQWVSNRFGRRLYQIFFKTYTEKVWGVPCTEIRAEWAAQRIQGLSLARALLAATSLQKRSSQVRTLIDKFKYPRLGPGQMWERCAELLTQAGGELRLNHQITDLDLADEDVVTVKAATPTGEQRFEAEHLISTMPLSALVRCLGTGVPDPVRAAARGLGYRDFILVALILDRPKLFPDNWIYIHTPGINVGRIQNFNNWSQALVPDPNKTCLGMEYFCSQGDVLWEQAPEVQSQHLKRWTLWSMIVTDVRHRGIPWMRLLMSQKVRPPATLNIRVSEQVCTVLVLLGCLAVLGCWWSGAVKWLAVAAGALVVTVAINAPLFSWLARQRGWGFALGALPHRLLPIYSI